MTEAAAGESEYREWRNALRAFQEANKREKKSSKKVLELSVRELNAWSFYRAACGAKMQKILK